MKFLNKVMKYFTMFQSKNAPESQSFAGEASHDRPQGAKVAAIAGVLHHHEEEFNDVRAKVAAIAAALHHHEMESSQSSGSFGIAALVAAIHHHNNLKK